MATQFVYVYFMKEEPEKVGEVIGSHIEYWQKLKLPKYIGGPFADRSGALITFEVENIEDAQKLVDGDPLVHADLVEKKWVKEWVVE